MDSFYNFFRLFAVFILLTATRSSICYKLTDERLKIYHQLELPSVAGPESIAFDCNGGGPYTGVSDGRILKWGGARLGWTEFAVTSPNRSHRDLKSEKLFGKTDSFDLHATFKKREVCDGSTDVNKEEMCGRPLGLNFNKATCDLYIADAYYGLLKVGPKGGVAKQLATTAEGVPFRFTNNLDIDTNSGFVYFTDTSTVYQRREFLLAVINGDRSGRLMKYDLKNKNVTVLLKGIPFANGVALSKDKSFLLVSQTSTSSVLRYWLKGSKAQTAEIFAQFDGFPDNIERTENGEFWIALDDGQGSFGGFVDTNDLRRESVTPLLKGSDVVAAAVKVDGNGKVMEVLNEKAGRTVMESVSDVRERNGSLWIGSLVMPCVGLFRA